MRRWVVFVNIYIIIMLLGGDDIQSIHHENGPSPVPKLGTQIEMGMLWQQNGK